MKSNNTILLLLLLGCLNCNKKTGSNYTSLPNPLTVSSVLIDGLAAQQTVYNIDILPVIEFQLSDAVDRNSVSSAVVFTGNSSSPIAFNISYSNNDKVIKIQPSGNLNYLSAYQINLRPTLKSIDGNNLQTAYNLTFITQIDSTDKFPRISDTALMELVQQQTFKYFWDFAHPVSGLARERNTSGEIVTSGGSGFGIMSIITGIHRNFISRQQGLERMQTIVGFLKNTAQKFHGAFSHWMNGSTGVVIPFSTKDNGADLVETSFLIQGLLTARQYFNSSHPSEMALRDDINSIWQGVEWNWFRKNNENVLYWHWSPNYNWDLNLPVRGWNEALITYVLAASSPAHSVPRIVYENGWAKNGAIRNYNSYYGYILQLGPPLGGPLFFEHYSFLGINPTGLSDQFANYTTQTINHTKINYEYCKDNPKGWFGYSDQCWGLTASDIPNGYTASSPANDIGVIAPTAALSSFPYTPTESMKALKFFYFILGDKLWGPHGFYDAFSLKDLWFANSYLAIDQGPIIVMIENYRSGLLWNLFTSCPEVKSGLQTLGFSAPYL